MSSDRDDEPGAGASGRGDGGGSERSPSGPTPIRIPPKMIALLSVGLVAALLIFWFEPSYTLRYVVVGVLGTIYVFLRFNDWR